MAKAKNLEWGSANRPKVSNKLGVPIPAEGSDGDMQIRQTNLGAKLFGKIGGRWFDTPLAIDGITRIGATFSNHLAISREDISIVKDSVKVAKFGEDITFNGKIIIGNPDGTFSVNDNINIGNAQSGIGAQNVCIGYQAGEDLDALSTVNVLIGYQAGMNIAGFTGTGNVCIGGSAGNAVTSQNNICIGNGSDSTTLFGIAIGQSVTTTGTYGIAIGNAISAATNDAVIGKSGNTITCDFDADGTWTQSSDIRKKTNIQDDTLGLAFINDLKTKTFQWKPANEHPEEWSNFSVDEDGNKTYVDINTDIIMHGLIAQEVKESLDKVNCSTFGGWKLRVDGQQELAKASFVTPLIKAVQELSAKIDAMQVEINNLK